MESQINRLKAEDEKIQEVSNKDLQELRIDNQQWTRQ